MPVPLSTTHANGAGLQAAQNAELPTSGPFARLAQQSTMLSHELGNGNAADANNAASSSQPQHPNGDHLPALATNHLSFWYCDTGTISFTSLENRLF